MTKYIWRTINVWFWKETVRGTAVPVDEWQPKTELSFEDKQESIVDESSIGVIVDGIDGHIVKRWGEWDISGNVYANKIWFPLLSTLGSVVTSPATTWAYSHAFSLDNTNQHQSLTIGVNDPVLGDLQFPLAMIETLTISAEVWGFVTFTATYKSKEWDTGASHTVSYGDDFALLAKSATFKVASDLAGLDGVSAKCIQSFEITLTKNLDDDYCLGSTSPQDFINQQFMIEGSFVALFEDSADYRDNALDWTKQAIRFDMTDINTTIWVSDNPSLIVDLAKAHFTEFTLNQWNDEKVIQTLTFKGLYSTDDSKALDMTLVNTKDSY